MPKVLVVEDETLIRLHIVDSFRDSGFAVVEAADGADALRALEQDPLIDAVFTDITLPGEVDGFAVARWVRSRRPAVPVFLTSGEVTAAHAERVAGAEPFFAKPCDYLQVAEIIRGRLEKCPC